MERIFPLKTAIILSVLVLPIFASSQETYKFERMWPTLKQPWYFFNLSYIATDAGGNIYVSDIFNHRIQKFTSDGTFVSTWGNAGSANGEFLWPHGIATDQAGDIYVVDSGHHRIQKFTSDGTFLSKWGSFGTGDGEFNEPRGIAIDADDNIYVLDMDNHRIQKFTSDGTFLSKWGKNGGDGTLGSGDGEFESPQGITIDVDNNVYVADTYNHRIQKFTSGGTFLSMWGNNGGDGTSGSGDGEFDRPKGIAAGADGNIYVADTYNDRLQKFAPDGTFISTWEVDEKPEGVTVSKGPGDCYIVYERYIQKITSGGMYLTQWKSFGSENGKFDRPAGIAIDADNNVYVADTYNHRIQKFTSDGTFLMQRGSEGSADGEFRWPHGIATDQAGNIYVADTYNHRIQKFTSDGTYISRWGRNGGDGTLGSGDGEFNRPKGIVIDVNENVVYVVDNYNYRIQKFRLDGTYIMQWGSSGSGDGEFIYPEGIALDGDGHVYVADTHNHRIQKFASDGTYIDTWGSFGSGDGEFRYPHGVGVDVNENTLCIADNDNNRIQKFDLDGTFISTWGSFGSMPDQLSYPTYLSIGSQGKVYVADTGNDRIQVFKKFISLSNPKAIIVAGGGPYDGNNLWDATQVCTNMAYRTLIYQGFGDEDIYYLSADTDLDLDNNGEAEVDGLPTIANLQTAITQWALNENAESLIVYLNDHGGPDTFSLHDGIDGVLSSSALASWLAEFEASTSGKVAVIYEACESGSFIDDLKGDDRIIITSTLAGEQAKFLSSGTISFSNFFWTHIFNGLSIEESYLNATEIVNFAFSNQNPQLDGDAQNIYIGNHVLGMIGPAPTIGSISEPQEIIGEGTTALLSAGGVTDPDGIARVWAVIWPPDYVPDSSEKPLLTLPSCELLPVGGDRYEGTYGEFTTDGSYQIAIYAMDGNNNTSLPQLTTVSRNYHVERKAIIIEGWGPSEDVTSSFATNAGIAYDALRSQGYSDNDIYFMSASGMPGFDVAPSVFYLGTYLQGLAGDGDIENLDLTIYLIGQGDTGSFTMNGEAPADLLYASQLYEWLDTLQAAKPGEVKIIYDGNKSGSFIINAPPSSASFITSVPHPPASERIIITSSTEDGPAYFSGAGDICFSSFFWSQVAGGATLYDAVAYAKKAMAYLSRKDQIAFTCYEEQTPQLEASGNGVANEEADYQIARARTIGIGLKTASDAPRVGPVSVEPAEGTIIITAEKITSTSPVERVWAVIESIRYCPGFSGSEISEKPEIELGPVGEGIYEGTTSDPAIAFKVVVYAVDEEGSTSPPRETRIYQAEGGDIYEYDNTRRRSNVIVIDHPVPQPHNFHYASDEDWVSFYGVRGEYYIIAAGNLGSDCTPVMELYYRNETIPIYDEDTILNNMVSIDFECLTSGFYYVRLFNSTTGENTDYELSVYHPYWPDALTLIAGKVEEKGSLNDIDGAAITTTGGGSAVSVGGEYEFMQKPGDWWMDAVKSGYSFNGVDLTVQSGVEFMQRDILMRAIRPACNQDNDCDDGLFCNGIELCVDGTCQEGSIPCSDDGLFCNGEETCDEAGDSCANSGNPCSENLRCNEVLDACADCTEDADCDDGFFCTGVETCVNGICQPGSSPCPEGVTCDEEGDACNNPHIAVTPQSMMQARWMPLPLFIRITGTNTHFDGSSEVTFSPASVMALPFVWGKGTITCIGLMMPSFLTEPNDGTVEVSITTGLEEVSATVGVRPLLPMLQQGERLVEARGER